MDATMKQKKLKLKTARRDQYKRYTRSAGGNVIYTLFQFYSVYTQFFQWFIRQLHHLNLQTNYWFSHLVFGLTDPQL